MIKNVKIMAFIFSVFFVVLQLFSNTNYIFADQLKLGVAPSLFNDIEIQRGTSKEITFKVTNSSIFAGQDKNKEVFYTANIKISSADLDLNSSNLTNLTNEEQMLVLPSKWITFDKTDFNLKSGEIQEVKAKINVPKNADVGENYVIIQVERGNMGDDSSSVNKNTVVNTVINSIIQIPVIFIVTDPNIKSDSIYSSAKIKDFIIDDNLKSQSVWDIIKGLLTFDKGWESRVEDFLYKPYKISYKKDGKEYVYYDIPNIKKETLRNVSTNDKTKISNSKYILLPNGLTDNTIVDSIEFPQDKPNQIQITTKNKLYTIQIPNSNILNDIKKQITYLSTSINLKPKFSWVLDNVTLNSNIKYEDIHLSSKYDILNDGKRTIVPIGRIQLLDKNNQKFGDTEYQYAIILPNGEKEIFSDLKLDSIKLKNGTYTLESVLTPYVKSKSDITKKTIVIKDIRTYIIIGFISAFIILILLIVSIIIIIKKYVSKRRQKTKLLLKSVENKLNSL